MISRHYCKVIRLAETVKGGKMLTSALNNLGFLIAYRKWDFLTPCFMHLFKAPIRNTW